MHGTGSIEKDALKKRPMNDARKRCCTLHSMMKCIEKRWHQNKRNDARNRIDARCSNTVHKNRPQILLSLRDDLRDLRDDLRDLRDDQRDLRDDQRDLRDAQRDLRDAQRDLRDDHR